MSGIGVTTDEYEHRMAEIGRPPYRVHLKRDRGTLLCREFVGRRGSAVTVILMDGTVEIVFLMMVESITTEPPASSTTPESHPSAH